MGSRKIPEIRRDLLDKCVAKGIEIKTQCIFCGKRFWVQASTVAWAMHHNGDRIDIFMTDVSRALQWGRQPVEVRVIE